MSHSTVGLLQSLDALRATVLERDALKARCEALKKDAARYRYIREADHFPLVDLLALNAGDDLDAAIDARLASADGEKV